MEVAGPFESYLRGRETSRVTWRRVTRSLLSAIMQKSGALEINAKRPNRATIENKVVSLLPASWIAGGGAGLFGEPTPNMNVNQAHPSRLQRLFMGSMRRTALPDAVFSV